VLEEHEFLARIYDLRRMPSTDHRKEYDTAYLDIWQHRIRNQDWSDDWLVTDSRFDLLYGPDEPFLRFLAETVHPVVRPDSDKASAMVSEYNSHLAIDGWELYVVREISNKPVFGYRRIADGAQRHLESRSVTQMARLQPHHPKAFISHATLDHPFVEKFAADLRANGVDAWFSKWEIKPGDSIPAKIDEGLEDCEFFIIVLSNNSIDRPWVQTELAAATMRKQNGKVRKIIPVKIQDCGDLPPTLASLLWEDLSNQPYESALKRVLDSVFDRDLRPALGQPRPDTVASTTPTKRLPDRRPKVVATNYGIPTGEGKEGVFLLNEGEVAHRVSIPPITLDGERTLHFAGDLTVLIHDGFLPALVSHGHEHSMNLDSVWRDLRAMKNIPATFPLTVRYSDFAGKRYRSICELCRDVMKESGFSIRFLTQEVEDESPSGDAV
jgi:hypothetical protein